MSVTLTETQTTDEWWMADPARTTVEFDVEHFWGLHTVRGRFRRFDGLYVVGTAGLEIELTITDPTYYTKPWTVTTNAQLLLNTELMEFICNENEKSTPHMGPNIK